MSTARFSLDGRVAVVSGGGRGLGRALSLSLAGAGATVVVADRDLARAEACAAQVTAEGGSALGLALDTRDAAGCDALVESVSARYGRYDVLVNNAAIDIIKPATDLTAQEWDAVVAVNLSGYFHLAQSTGRAMIAGGGGSVVNISSIAAVRAVPRLLVYGVAKAGVDQLTRSLALEWASHGVRVNAVAPGYLEHIMEGAGDEHAGSQKQEDVLAHIPMGRRARLEEIVGPVLFLASDAASYITGHVLCVDGGYTSM